MTVALYRGCAMAERLHRSASADRWRNVRFWNRARKSNDFNIQDFLTVWLTVYDIIKNIFRFLFQSLVRLIDHRVE